MSFVGFSEEELQKIKSHETVPVNGLAINVSQVKKLEKIGAKPKRLQNQYKLTVLQKQTSDEIDDMQFAKCKLSLNSSMSPTMGSTNEDLKTEFDNNYDNFQNLNKSVCQSKSAEIEETEKSTETTDINSNLSSRKHSTDSTPDIVRGVANYTEDELAAHKMKLQDLQLKQKIMEEQNKKRKEMLAKALADRTKQTKDEVMKLEKIKKELQVLDGQFSQDVAVLRKKIDHACLSYAEAEKHYLKVEKEFLQAKISLQKEREKKELLTEHLCALITHNETRKAQKLETLMQELAADRKVDITVSSSSINDDDEEPVIIDGVDQKTGKIVEMPTAT